MSGILCGINRSASGMEGLEGTTVDRGMTLLTKRISVCLVYDHSLENNGGSEWFIAGGARYHGCRMVADKL